jgi:dienelactone hydrolase
MRHRTFRRPFVFCQVLLCVALGSGGLLRADAPRVLPQGQLPDDKRLGPLKDLNGYFPFQPRPTLDAWKARAERLRRQLLVATGLWPMPTKTPDRAVIHGRVDRDGYTVEKVFLESYPGHFVTGNLYRPKGRSGKLPAVLSPHGHWAGGRFYEANAKEHCWALVRGEERFDTSGRYPLQARCATLARMGCVVFHYDMVGYADSVQLKHGPGFRPEMSKPDSWGYFSPQAESRLQSMMGLQTYNSIRALDWLSSLPDVDPKRIGVTGASGGGTQTFILSAIDPRPAVAFPAVMVGTAMQGGCTCENCCLLRVGTGNVEISALIAPRPLGMTAADDWTKEIATKGLPELKQHYRLFGKEDLVMAKPLVQFPHNYNYVSRAVMYLWMNKHLRLGLPEPIVEEDFKPLAKAEMSVWDDQHPRPRGGDEYERSLVRWITEDSQRQMEALVPRDAASLAEYRRVVGGAVDVMIGRSLPPAGAIQVASRHQQDAGDWRMTKLLLSYPAEGEQVPAILLEPKPAGKAVAVWIDKQGKQGLFDGSDSATPNAQVRGLLAAGIAVLGVDLFGQGEFTPDGKPLAKARLNREHGWDRYLGYTLGYNHSLFAQRVHDLLSAVSYLRSSRPAGQRISLVGLGGAGHWVAAARAQAGPAVDVAVVDTAGFRFANIAALDDPDLLPGGAKYLDLPGILALSAPHRLIVLGEKGQMPLVVSAAYQAAGHPEAVSLPGEGAPAQLVKWLTP